VSYESFAFLPTAVRQLAAKAAARSAGVHWLGRGDVSDYAPFAGAWELSAGLVKLLRSSPLLEARQTAVILWTALADGHRRLVDALEVHERERQELLARIDALNEHIDHLGGP
jgi:hypothetical protein